MHKWNYPFLFFGVGHMTRRLVCSPLFRASNFVPQVRKDMVQHVQGDLFSFSPKLSPEIFFGSTKGENRKSPADLNILYEINTYEWRIIRIIYKNHIIIYYVIIIIIIIIIKIYWTSTVCTCVGIPT